MTPSSLNENAQKWVRALRSGLFKQTKGYLCQSDIDNNKRFCCLGVACELAALDGVPISKGRNSAADDGVITYDASTGLLPQSVQNWLGLSCCDGTLDDYVDGYTCLTELNDSADYSFEQIADLVESNPDGLFRQQ